MSLADKKALVKAKKEEDEASQKLKELESNDATQALAALGASLEAETAASNAKGSGYTAEDARKEREKMLAE